MGVIAVGGRDAQKRTGFRAAVSDNELQSTEAGKASKSRGRGRWYPMEILNAARAT